MKRPIAALGLALVARASIPSQGAAAPTPPVTGAYFALSVPDLQASTRWYQNAFDLTVLIDVQGGDGVSATVLEGGGFMVELIQDPFARPRSESGPPLQGLVKAGFRVRDLDSVAARLRARNVPIAFGPFPREGANPPNLILRDNAGNSIQVFGE